MNYIVKKSVQDQSQLRLHRAEAARALLQLHQAGQLDKPELWTWEVLDLLPAWCLQSVSKRMTLQLCCGALLLAPELRLWIDREWLVAGHTIIGKSLFNAIVLQTDGPQVPQNIAAHVNLKPPANPTVSLAEWLRVEFAKVGASVLNGSLSDALPTHVLSASVGESAGDIEFDLANALLTKAMVIMDETPTTEFDSSSHANGQIGVGVSEVIT